MNLIEHKVFRGKIAYLSELKANFIFYFFILKHFIILYYLNYITKLKMNTELL